jgi:hypothetical protein
MGVLETPIRIRRYILLYVPHAYLSIYLQNASTVPCDAVVG